MRKFPILQTTPVMIAPVTVLVVVNLVRKEEEVGGGERDAGKLSLMTLLSLSSEREERYIAAPCF